MLFHGQVRVALEEEHVLPHQRGRREGRLHVAELERHVLVNVRSVAVLVDPHLGMGERLLDRHQRAQRLIVDLDQLRGSLGCLLVHRRHRGDRVAHHADLGAAEGLLVLGHGEDAELHRGQVGPRDDRVHPRHLPGPRGIDARDEGVRAGAAEELGEGHAREHEVVGVFRVAGDLGPGVDLGQRLPDDGELRGAHRDSLPASRNVDWPDIRRAASSTASRIFVYPVHRQRLPASASRICSRLGCRDFGQEGLSREQDPGGAVAALGGAQLGERLLQRV